MLITVLAALGVERALEELEGCGRIGDRRERLGRRRDHAHDGLRGVVVRAEAREGGGELEARFVERRIDLDGALKVTDAVAQAIELLHLDVAERREPARVLISELLAAGDDAAESARIGDVVETTGARVVRRAEET